MKLAVVVVHLDAGRRCPARVRIAARIAAEHGAHLVGVAPTGLPDVILTLNSAVPDSLDIVGWSAAGLRSQAEQLAADFEKIARDAGVSSFAAEVVEGEAVDETIRVGRASDLVVIGQTDIGHPVDGIARDFPQQVLVHTGTPVLVVSGRGAVDTVGTKALVGWKNTREAARALRDALPMLQRASQVFLLEVEEESDAPARADRVEPARDYLRRHGIDATGVRAGGPGEVGEVLLAEARRRSCDLLVMGGYGHSRAREWIAGGATRHVLAHADIAVLLSH